MTIEIREPPTSLLMSYLLRAQDAQERGDRQTALKFYTLALQIDPDCTGALNNLAMIHAQNEHHIAAAVLARRAVANSPDQMYVAANCGMILSRNVAFVEAQSLFKHLVADYPQNADFWQGLGIAYVVDDVDQAIKCFERALELSPDNALVHKNLGLALLAVRDWDEGFKAWRRSGLDTTEDAAFSPLPQWRGESLDGKTILVHHEQGYGDTIQFCRFLRLLEGRVILAVPSALVRLMRMADVVDEVIDFADPMPCDVDYQIPLMFPWAYRSIASSFGGQRFPYLIAPKNGPRVNRAPGALLLVGVCWAGNPAYGNDKQRSMSLENLLPLAAIPGVQIVSLQKGEAAADVKKFAVDALVQDISGQVCDFADLAYAIEQLDMVVSIDSAPLHLAGALGKPAVVMLAKNHCWRWGRDTQETPFYPSVHLVTQSRLGDWSDVLEQVRKAVVTAIGDLRVTPEPQTDYELLDVPA